MTIAELVRQGQTLEAYNRLYDKWWAAQTWERMNLISHYLQWVRERHEAQTGRHIL